MFKTKDIRIIAIIIVSVVIGYVLYNQLFYSPTIPIDTPGNIIEEPDDNDEEPNDQPFEGVLVDWMPYSDESDRVKLYISEDELLSIKTMNYHWESKAYPVYEKAYYTLEEQIAKANHVLEKTELDVHDLVCEDFNQDGLGLVMCQFEEGYLEVLQDGSYYIIFFELGVVPISSYDYEVVLEAIMESWINDVIELDSWELVLNDLHYDTFGNPIYDYIIVESLDTYDYQTIYSLSISSVDQKIVGISKNSDVVDVFDTYQVLSIEEINSYLKQGLFHSSMVTINELPEVEIIGYGLTYDDKMFLNVVVPILHIYVTSEKSNFSDCFDVKGIVVHPIKMIAFDKSKIRVR